MAEMVVVIALIIVLATVVLTNVVGEAGRASAGPVAQGIRAFESSINAFRSQVGRYPGSAAGLVRPITAADFDSCGNNMPGQVIDLWAGPYLNREVPAGGVAAGDATILPTFVRDPTDNSGTSFGTLTLRVIDVDQGIAEEVDAAFDGDDDLAAGAIRWVDATGSAPDTLKYVIPIRGC